VGWRAEAFWALRRCEKLEPKIPRKRIAAVRRLMEACDYRRAYEQAAALLLEHRADTHHRWEPPVLVLDAARVSGNAGRQHGPLAPRR